MQSIIKKRKICSFLLAFCVCLGILFNPVTVLAENIEKIPENTSYQYKNDKTGYQAYIFDNAEWLSIEEKTELLNQMSPLTEYCNAIFLTDTNNTRYSESYSENLCVDTMHQFFGFNENAVIYLIDNEYDYICAQGETQKIITSSKAISITDNVYKYSADGEYGKAALKAFSQINDVIHGRMIAQPMKIFCNFFIAIFLALLINYAYVSSKSKLKRTSTSSIILSAENNMKYHDRHSYRYRQEKVYMPTKSSGGGGFSGGSFSGGGGFHGGGFHGGGFHGGGHSGGGHSH